jgi:hypothetical protein
MKDFRVVLSKTLLKVTSGSPVRDFLPPAIIVLGERFNLCDEITYNDIEVTEFIIASSTRLLVRIPPSQVGRALTDLKVLAPVPLTKEDALISLGISRPLRTVEGIDRLVQEWLMTFLTTPGTDIFDPTSGGGARSIIGQPAQSNGNSAVTELSLAVDNTRQQFLKKQAKNSKIPPSERLLSASLANVRFNEQTTAITAIVDIKNVLGGSASISVR